MTRSAAIPRKQEIPLPEYAGRGTAIIEPSALTPKGVRLPPRAVLCFFDEALGNLPREAEASVLHHLQSGLGRHPIYAVGRGRNQVAVLNPGIGSVMAAAAMEQVIALGARRIIACGSAGALHGDIEPGSVVIPTAAVRDEGTSHHYQPRRRTNRPSRDAVEAVKTACERRGVPYITGKTWTTDAVFRETPRKIQARREEGCLTVEMEAAAFFAVARFRRVRFGQLLYAEDDVSGKRWDRRMWPGRSATRRELLTLAIDAAKLMDSRVPCLSRSAP